MNGNPFYEPYWNTELEHHGVLGMEWGKRNGPPYPLDRRKDGSITKAQKEKKRSLNQRDKTKRNLNGESFFQKHKKEIAIGAGVAATLLASYGVYKLSKVYKDNGGSATVQSILGKFGSASDIKPKMLKYKESISDTVKAVNPLRSSPEGDNNCVCCSMASILRQMGYDVTAKAAPGQKPLNSNGVIEACFNGAKIFDGRAIKFGKSREDAAEMLVKLYGQNAQGIVGIQWKNKSAGHAFNWKIIDGKVQFFDGQKGLTDEMVSKYFTSIDPSKALMLAGLDDATINFEEISKYVAFK